jgi:hypothetical protein
VNNVAYEHTRTQSLSRRSMGAISSQHSINHKSLDEGEIGLIPRTVLSISSWHNRHSSRLFEDPLHIRTTILVNPMKLSLIVPELFEDERQENSDIFVSSEEAYISPCIPL